MKIFVTGGTGFVGSHFLQQVMAAGHTVIAQRRPGSQPRLALPMQAHWVDRALDQDFSAELSGCYAVVHLAAHTPNPPYAPRDECLHWYVVAATRLLQQAATQGVSKFIVAGTCFEYGLAAEGMDLIHPATELRPTLTYPISKAAASTACLGLARNLGLSLQVLRIFQVYGEGEAAVRFWPSLHAAALAGKHFPMSAGVQIRDFISAPEVAAQFVAALDFNAVEPGLPHVRNIGTGQAQTLLEFAQHWWQKFGATGRLLPGEMGLRPGELARLVANVSDVHIA